MFTNIDIDMGRPNIFFKKSLANFFNLNKSTTDITNCKCTRCTHMH